MTINAMVTQSPEIVDTAVEFGVHLSPEVTGFPAWWRKGLGGHTPWPNPPAGLRHVRATHDESKATTGLFDLKSEKRDRANLLAVDCIGLDADAADWMVATGQYPSTEAAKQVMHRQSDADADALNTALMVHRRVILGLVEAAGYPPPTRIVHSGYGLHLWWHLDSPVWKSNAGDWATMQFVAPMMIAKINETAGWHAMDPAAKDGGTRLLAVPGHNNVKGHAKRRVLISGWSDTRLTIAQVESWIGVRTTIDPINGRVRKTRPGPLQGGARSPIEFVDLASPEYRMPDGRTMLAWIQDLAPGSERVGCPAPGGRDGKNSITLHHESKGHPWEWWAHDFGRDRNLVHMPEPVAPQGPRGGLTLIENPDEHEIVPVSLYTTTPHKTNGDNSHPIGILDEVGPPPEPTKAQPAPTAALIEPSLEDAAAKIAADRLAPAPTGALTPDELDHLLEQAIAEAIGEPVPPTKPYSTAAVRFGDARKAMVCTRAPWLHSAKTGDHEALAMRLVCRSRRCPDCAPLLTAAAVGAVEAVLGALFANGAGLLRQWRVLILPNLGEAKTLTRWADAAPRDRHYLTIATQANVTHTFVMYRSNFVDEHGDEVHRPKRSKTRPSRLDQLLDEAVEYRVPSMTRWIIQHASKLVESIDVDSWDAKQIRPIRGRGWLIKTIMMVRNALLGIQPESTEKDPDRVSIVSHMTPKEVQRLAEETALASTAAEQTTQGTKIGAVIATRVRWGFGADPTPAGTILEGLIHSGAIPKVRSKRGTKPRQDPTPTGWDDALEWIEGTER